MGYYVLYNQKVLKLSASLVNLFPYFSWRLIRLLCDEFFLWQIDPIGNMDPYAILKCRSQEQRSSIAAG
jgi:hypothetical protein